MFDSVADQVLKQLFEAAGTGFNRLVNVGYKRSICCLDPAQLCLAIYASATGVVSAAVSAARANVIYLATVVITQTTPVVGSLFFNFLHTFAV